MNVLIGMVFIYFMSLWAGYIIFFIGSINTIMRKYYEAHYNNIIGLMGNIDCLPVSVIMPVFNYGKNIQYAIEAILKADYPNLRLIIVNDGSTDDTLQILIKRYQLFELPASVRHEFPSAPIIAYYRSATHPKMTVVDKQHYQAIDSGADAINAGLSVCKTPLFFTIDSDTIIDRDSISHMLFSYLSHPYCVAVGGNIYIPDEIQVKNGGFQPLKRQLPTNLTLGVQIVEYLRSFFYGHEGWSSIGGALCHSGAFSLFDFKAIKLCKGFDRDNFSYDSEIIMNLHQVMQDNQLNYSVQYAPSAFAWARQPSDLKGLWLQRDRWQRGLWRSFFRHKELLFNPKYGNTGLIGFPYYFIFEIVGPVIEGIAYLLAFYCFLSGRFTLSDLFWCLLMAWSYLFCITLSCIFLNFLTYNQYQRKRDLFWIMILTLAEVVFYRPFKALDSISASIKYALHRFTGKTL